MHILRKLILLVFVFLAALLDITNSLPSFYNLHNFIHKQLFDHDLSGISNIPQEYSDNNILTLTLWKSPRSQVKIINNIPFNIANTDVKLGGVFSDAIIPNESFSDNKQSVFFDIKKFNDKNRIIYKASQQVHPIDQEFTIIKITDEKNNISSTTLNSSSPYSSDSYYEKFDYSPWQESFPPNNMII